MKIICNKQNLMNGVNIVLKAVSSKTTMPILECIIIEAGEDFIKLVSNDMELAIETIVKGTVEKTGRIAINAKIFSDIIRKLPDNDISISVDENYTATIVCEKSKFAIAGKSGEDFPVLPKVERDKSVSISEFTLKEVIRQTVFSISDNENNKIMTGELFDIKNNELRVVSLDGHRISIRRVNLKQEYENIKVIVPGKTLNEIAKILTDDIEKEVIIYFTNKHILFEFNDTLVLSRLIEGEYYRVDQMLSSDYKTRIIVNKKEFLNSIDRATLLIKESEKKPIVFNVLDDFMELKINSSLGSMKEELDIVKDGEKIMIGFNPRFLMDALRVIDDENINIYMTNPKAPCFIKDENETYIYLILPINFNAAAYE